MKIALPAGLRDALRDGVLFTGDDGQVYLGCAECGYGDGPAGPAPWDRAVDELEEAFIYWDAHRAAKHGGGGTGKNPGPAGVNSP